jgi:RNA polymerase sigma factor (sigma-70 family)
MNMPNKQKLDLFTEAYNNYYPLLFNAICGKVRDTHDTEDICQEVFIIFYNKFETIENHRAWLNGTMRNVVYDYYKRKGRNDEDINSIIEDSTMSYVNGFREARLIIEDVINNGGVFDDERDKTVFDLIAFNNYSYIDTAKLVKISYRQVRYSFKQSSRRIQEQLRNRGIKGLEELL